MGQVRDIFRGAWGTRRQSGTMNNHRIISAFVALIFVCSLASAVLAGDVPQAPAQDQASKPEITAPSLYNAYTPFRLLDLSRLSFHQSYSLSYFSGGGYSANQGVYTTSIGYRIADPLYVQVDLGLVHQPSALFGGDTRQLDARVRPNFFLRYAPSNKFSLSIDVRTMPAYGFGFGPSPWAR